MAFMGELSDIGVADLLYLLALRQQTGKLSVNANGDEVGLFIEQGRMILVTSSNMSLRLGKMLVRLEILTNERLRDALRYQEQSGRGRPLGTLLIEAGFITEQQLHRCVEEQCIEVLARVIAAEAGIFVFHRDARVAPKTEIVPLNSDRILLEATRRTDEMTELKARLPESDAPLMLAETVEQDAHLLIDNEIAVASALYGKASSLRELGDQVNIEDVALWRTVVRMIDQGWVVSGTAPERPRPSTTTHAART
jgi:hypothetical protein